MKSLLRFLRPIGTLLIFLFAFFCIVSSEVVRNADEESFFRRGLEYTAGFESRFYDYRMRKSIDPHYRSHEIVLIKIDDYSLSKLGTFPLPRTVWADLLNKLAKFNAKVVAFDVMFPEKAPATDKVNPDKILAEAMKNFQKDDRRAFISYNIYHDGDLPDEQVIKEAPIEVLTDLVNTQSTAQMLPMVISAFTFPIEEITASEVGLGFISMEQDPDGIFRKYQLIANINGDYIGSLGFNAYESWIGKKNLIKISQTSGGEVTGELELDENNKLIIDGQGQSPIRFKGQEAQFPDISLADVLDAKDTDEKMMKLFGGKIVFVGSIAEGAHDLRPTPLDGKTPGVYAHINFAQMLINKYLFAPENDSLKISLALLILGLAIFILVHRFDNALIDLIVVAVLIIGSYNLDRVYFLPNGYKLKLFYCYFCFFMTYSWHTFLNFYEANKEKRQIKGTFARYVAPTVVEEMLKDPDNIQVGGRKMDITCLFSDVRDFTSISEGLSAQDLANMLNTYMNAMTDIVFETKGTLDKYIGDAIVAIWGAPLPIGNHAEHAVHAAIRMAENMPGINEEFARKGLPFFHVGIGLNTGECSVGNMGSTRIFSYTALGDNMNLGARLEGLCKYYGTQILISDNTLSKLNREQIKTRPIDKVIVKGRQQAVGIHEVISRVHFMSKDHNAHQLYVTAWQLFTHKNFRGALDIYEQILSTYPDDKATKRLKTLCEKYLGNPSLVTDDFDVTKMTEK